MPNTNFLINSGYHQQVNDSENTCVKLRICQLDECEARCCYDGVYLEAGEEEKIREIVLSEPEFFKTLPADYIVDGSWQNLVSGRKTAVKPYDFQSEDFPAHFTRTRCIFCRADHKCLLQVLAEQKGLHKWAYKPKTCWLFPLDLIGGELEPPPAIDEEDPLCMGDEYPGYTKFVPCGQDRPDGDPWFKTLAAEIAYWFENHCQT